MKKKRKGNDICQPKLTKHELPAIPLTFYTTPYIAIPVVNNVITTLANCCNYCTALQQKLGLFLALPHLIHSDDDRKERGIHPLVRLRWM